jgi:tetratricopeptide (TPR) repeat protein
MAYNRGELHDAERLGLRALLDAEETTNPEYARAVTLNCLALVCLATNRLSEAEHYLDSAERSAYADPGYSQYEIAGSILRSKANLMTHQRKYSEAERLFSESLSLLEKGLPDSAFEMGRCLCDKAGMYLLQRRLSEAMPLATEALKRLTKADSEDVAALEKSNFIINACACGEDEEKLFDLFQSTAVKWQYEVGPHNPELVRALNIFARYLLKKGKLDLLESMKNNFSSVHLD